MQVRVLTSIGPKRTYWKCERCNFIEVDALDHLTLKDESDFYHHHENRVDDSRYRQYAIAVTAEATRKYEAFISENAVGNALDFGCGPGPVVASLLRERGIPVDEYDPFFFPRGVTQKAYSVIVACEVVEHFRKPRAEFSKIFDLLLPGGWLVVQTERLEFVKSFDDWYYRKDPTHIAFYSDEAFWNFGREIGFDQVEIIDRKLVSMRRPTDAAFFR
jgi:hypothetical protein